MQRYKICQQFTTVHLRENHLLIVSDVQRYKICQQFTTCQRKRITNNLLFQTCKDTKFVSNSQHEEHILTRSTNCFRRAKIQNLSAIHNSVVYTFLKSLLFQTCKDTKFVSNSQLPLCHQSILHHCFRRAKIQNLSAIHNCRHAKSTK